MYSVLSLAYIYIGPYSFIMFRYFHLCTSIMIHWYAPLGCRWIMSRPTTDCKWRAMCSGFITAVAIGRGIRTCSKVLSFHIAKTTLISFYNLQASCRLVGTSIRRKQTHNSQSRALTLWNQPGNQLVQNKHRSNDITASKLLININVLNDQLKPSL